MTGESETGKGWLGFGVEPLLVFSGQVGLIVAKGHAGRPEFFEFLVNFGSSRVSGNGGPPHKLVAKGFINQSREADRLPVGFKGLEEDKTGKNILVSKVVGNKWEVVESILAQRRILEVKANTGVGQGGKGGIPFPLLQSGDENAVIARAP